MKRKIIVSFVEQLTADEKSPLCLDGPLDKVIESFVALRETIPAEYRHLARFEIESELGYALARITYERVETDLEESERLVREADLRKAAERRDRETYEALKRRFEP
jgi:hypothetical protein